MASPDPAVRKAPGSLRDPAGPVVIHDGVVYRLVRLSYAKHYGSLMSSGLYDRLASEGLLIPHEEVSVQLPGQPDAYKVLRPQNVPFISYPYEWCFSELKDAALATLRIQKLALEYGMTLKDASAFNLQFVDGRPLFIDTLSFEVYTEREPWAAYRQFCGQFLGPLALMSYRDPRLGRLSSVHLDGLPLDLVSRLLPARASLKPGLFAHVRLHAALQARYGRKKSGKADRAVISKAGMLGLVESLEGAVRGLRCSPARAGWAAYYEGDSYSPEALAHKVRIVEQMAVRAAPVAAWDLGANTGVFSKALARYGVFTVAFDADHAATELDYLECKESGEKRLLPLVMDLTNPSPSLGWASEERTGLIGRGPVDLVLALALVHHLAIGAGIPFEEISSLFSKIARRLIVEFVPASDPKAALLMSTRRASFDWYTEDKFLASFSKHFGILDRQPVTGSGRTLYLMGREATI